MSPPAPDPTISNSGTANPVLEARALAKRYAQDSPLDWGVAADRKSEDLTQHAPEGATLKAARKEKQDAAYRRNDRDDGEREG